MKLTKQPHPSKHFQFGSDNDEVELPEQEEKEDTTKEQVQGESFTLEIHGIAISLTSLKTDVKDLVELGLNVLDRIDISKSKGREYCG